MFRPSTNLTGNGLRPIRSPDQDHRYLEDRNRITGAWVTSGIDFGLRIVERLQGRMMAEAAQLAMEYAPEPPFSSGTPSTANPAVTADVRAVTNPYWLDRKAAEEGK